MAARESLNMSPEHVAMRRELKKRREREYSRKLNGAPSRKRVAEALRLHGGNVSDAANYLGTTALLVRRKIAESQSLQDLCQEITEQISDFAENVVVQQVLSGNVNVSMWWLKTKGKERGYTEKGTTELELGEKSINSANELIKAMREGRKEIEDQEALEGGEVAWLPKQLEENHDQQK